MQIPPINPNDKQSGKIQSSVNNQDDIEQVFEEQKAPDKLTVGEEDNIPQSTKKDGGIWASIMEELKGFFDKNKTETEIETEKILEERGIVDANNINDVKNLNTYLEAKRQEYLVSHPEPVFNTEDNPGLSALNQEEIKAQWQNGLNQFLAQEENKYKSDNDFSSSDDDSRIEKKD